MKRIDRSLTKKFTDKDGDWIELRTRLSKGERDELGEIQQNYRMDPKALIGDPEADYSVETNSRIAEYNRTLFGFLCTAWSLDGEPSAEAYTELDETTGAWVDSCMIQTLVDRVRAEGNVKSISKKPKSSRTSPPKAEESKSQETA